uniref:Receptor protein-tyrosine kinase n=1 Tax=Panagrolaimus sp. ES5 TaxID=591445 RepID=A0AC34GYK7_9BILA
MHTMHRYQENERNMTLEIRKVELGDKGEWRCRVWNNEGSITRNFTLHIIDPIKMFDYLAESGVPDVENLLPGLHSHADLQYLKYKLRNWNPNLDIDAKIQDMSYILKNRPSAIESNNGLNDDDYNSVEPEEQSKTKASEEQSKTRASGISQNQQPHQQFLPNIPEEAAAEEEKETTLSPTMATVPFEIVETTTRSGYWPGPRKLTNLAPYFRQASLHGSAPIISPAGRTVKLSCRASGQPQPHVIWHKNNIELSDKSERNTGAPYKFRKFSLEMQDAVESDSGMYHCEVFNKHGTIRRDFEVTIVDRARSKPIIVPNVLMNETVNVNSTVNFTCKVISDSLPYFSWAKLLMINGSYINYTDPAEPKFNILDTYFMPRAKVSRDHRVTILTIINVTLDDQGLYACIAGNSLGLTMANATLTVNEFRPMTLPTEQLTPPTDFQYVLFIALIFFAVAILAAVATYIVYQRRQSKNRIQNLDKMGVLKKVVITKKEPKDGEFWPDLASSYAITIESVIRKQEHENSGDTSFSPQYEVPTDDRWEIDRSKLTLTNILGEGAFGEVWQAILQKEVEGGNYEEEPVAVKKLKQTAQDKELIILVGEMQIFKSIGEHKNVLKLIGCSTGLGPLYVVLELCRHGNLRSFLQSHRRIDEEPIYNYSENSESSVNYVQPHQSPSVMLEGDSQQGMRKLMLRDLIRFATEISRGMEFLAAKKIIHRDLAARNVLVAENYTMKISDFGLSRNVIHNDYYRKHGNGNLPIKWMAPESLDEDRHIYTTYSDVWSYGVIVWEIMTLGEQPYRNIPMGCLYEKLKSGYRMEAPPTCPEEISSVMQRCWRDIPEERPSFKTIGDYFDKIIKGCDTYKEETHSEPSPQQSDDSDNGDEGLIYDIISPLQPRKRPMLVPDMESFEDFVEKSNINSIDNAEDSPLLGRRSNASPKIRRKGRPKTEPYYFNMEAARNNEYDSAIASPMWNERNETEGESDATNLSETESLLARQRRIAPIEHDYVNNEALNSRSKHSSKSSKASNNYYSNTGVRNSQFSDSSAFEMELGTMIYSSPPSKKSSSSNLSVGVTQPPVPSRVSSQNGFIQRSYSTESQTSSGRGGSSAMSSAEGLGGIGDLCQIEYTTINPTRTPSSSNPKLSPTKK